MTVREKETILDEKIIETKEEVVVDPITGEHSVQTFEYVEKTIEKEVCYENIKQKSNEWKSHIISAFCFLEGFFLHRTIFCSSIFA